MTGTYTQITEIIAPDNAVAGSIVRAEVHIKNIYSANIHIYCVAVLEESRFIDWLDLWQSPGQTLWYAGSFTMPSKGVTIIAYSYYMGVDGYLYLDDSKSKSVALAALVPTVTEFKLADYVKA